jgi:hypothetical protein
MAMKALRRAETAQQETAASKDNESIYNDQKDCCKHKRAAINIWV